LLNPGGLVKLLAVIGASSAILYGVWLIFQWMRAIKQGVGPNSLKVLDVVLFVPSLVISAVSVQAFKPEALRYCWGL